ncbi:hypothetical protein [Bradyrhizobium sp. CCBAU 51753]|uniref:hypothetical protein n=1 Tax=Bradyrhizobium sp. CCBAU 51753 TaxID=1325100 RepID=UPI00188AFEE0|nr:hypothetical protein [Bradyrhizobium sp. CCBAU 51753]QOZ25120.1 hypothetical protein XH93_17095 [Bradyrhizobium sp. CCBAU 51753]
MEYRGIVVSILQSVPNSWRWQFECNGISRNGHGSSRQNAARRARTAVDVAIKDTPADRSAWHIGQRVSRKNCDELGTVVENNGQIKVKWDSGQTSYFSHNDRANVEIAPATHPQGALP